MAEPVSLTTIAGALGLGSMMFDQFFNFRNANRNFDLQRKAYFGQKRMNQLAQHNYENAVQIRANDYEKAGFNRLLAANGGVGSGPVGHVGNPAQDNYTSNIADRLMAYKNMKLLDQQIKMQQQDIIMKNQEIEYNKYNNQRMKADARYRSKEADDYIERGVAANSGDIMKLVNTFVPDDTVDVVRNITSFLLNPFGIFSLPKKNDDTDKKGDKK